MTPTRYLIARIAQNFGFGRSNVRMGDAAAEAHLLREAEGYLGEDIWERVRNIEALSVEYWNLRKLTKERAEAASNLEALQAKLQQAHEERTALLILSNEPFSDLHEERQRVLDYLEKLAHERDAIVAEAREVRRNYEGVKTKYEVLEREGNAPEDELVSTRKRLAELKAQFEALKARRKDIGQQIEAGDKQIDQLDQQIAERYRERREKAYEAFLHIGEMNQEVSTLRAELGLLDTHIRQLYADIGRYVSRNSSEPACAAALKGKRGLVEVMAALRRSIQYNHKLAEALSQ